LNWKHSTNFFERDYKDLQQFFPNLQDELEKQKISDAIKDTIKREIME
jgi:hypothetical protein